VVNAKKATPLPCDGNDVFLSIEDRDDGLWLLISDRAEPLSDADAFSLNRGLLVRKLKSGELGFGTFLTRVIVDAHNSRIVWKPRPDGGNICEVQLMRG
jgi:hypothetical protein